MKKKSFLVLLYLLGIICIVHAQDFEPGAQAQGYLANKNSNVDLATGTFQYSIPLFELREGDYTLPVTLKYCQNTAILSAQDGLMGYSWSLQAGGIVTRVIRGGVADETPDKGYIFIPQAEQISDSTIVKVNKHENDGESDIFTAVFNGNSVHFIIKWENDSVVVKNLEKTNVKIKCSFNGQYITSWEITDENGIIYVYDVLEWTGDITRECEIVLQDINNQSYVSSWYITAIIIPNASTIHFVYSNKKINFNSINDYTCRYTYGRPMIRPKFDYLSHQHTINKYLEKAQYKAEVLYTRLSLQEKEKYGLSENIPFWDRRFDDMNRVLDMENNIHTIMGVAGSFSGNDYPTASISEALYNMINFYRYYPEVTNYLNLALKEIKRCFTEEKFSTNIVEHKYSYQIRTPLLHKIITSTNTLTFTYSRQTKELTLTDYSGNKIKKIIAYYNANHRLSHLLREGRDNNAFQQQTFKYGQLGLLNEITLPTGGYLKIDHERFTCSRTDQPMYRVRMCRSSDGSNGEDSIYYNYLSPGKLVYDNISNRDTIKYTTFKDYLERKGLPIHKGNVLINQGNNGVYFECVEEVLKGKGSTLYLFAVPKSSRYNKDQVYPFWLCGLPLGKAIYDKNGSLVYLQKCKYYTDMSLLYLSGYQEWFEDAPGAFKYTRYLWQTRSSDYFIDAKEINHYYAFQPKSKLYYDGKWVYSNPSQIYWDNFDARTKLASPVYRYKLYYGGKTVLKSTKEYMIPGGLPGKVSLIHLTGTLPSSAILVSEHELCYDHADASTIPTRLIKYQADGSQLVSLKRGVLDMIQIDPVSREMSLANQVNHIIKEQDLLLKPGATSYVLINEKITKYKKIKKPGSPEVFVIDKQYSYSPKKNIEINVKSPDNKLFSSDTSEYKKVSFNYVDINKSELPVESISSRGTQVICYDKGRKNPILKAGNTTYQLVDAIDKYRTYFDRATTGDSLVNGLSLHDYLEIYPDANHKKYTVFILAKPSSPVLSLNCTIQNPAGGTTQNTINQNVIIDKWQLVKYTIDLSNDSKIQLLRVNLPHDQYSSGVIVPIDVPFEATSYDSSGALTCKFNQNGDLERYEYDSKGRVLKIIDSSDNIIKEFVYEN